MSRSLMDLADGCSLDGELCAFHQQLLAESSELRLGGEALIEKPRVYKRRDARSGRSKVMLANERSPRRGNRR